MKQPKYKFGDIVYWADETTPGILEVTKPLKVNGMTLNKKGVVVYYFEEGDFVEVKEDSIFASREELLDYVDRWLDAAPNSRSTKDGE